MTKKRINTSQIVLSYTKDEISLHQELQNKFLNSICINEHSCANQGYGWQVIDRKNWWESFYTLGKVRLWPYMYKPEGDSGSVFPFRSTLTLVSYWVLCLINDSPCFICGRCSVLLDRCLLLKLYSPPDEFSIGKPLPLALISKKDF